MTTITNNNPPTTTSCCLNQPSNCRVESETPHYTIIGIIDDVERNPDLLLSVIIPVSTATRDVTVTGATYQVLIDTQPGAANLAGRQAPTALRPDQPERLQALVPPDPKRLRNQISGDITSLFESPWL